MPISSTSTTDASTYTFSELDRFAFDLNGWLLWPAVLSEDEIKSIKQFVYTLRDDPESLPEHERNTLSGPCSMLLDHPAAVAVLREIIAPDMGKAHGFRCDHSTYTIREPGSDPPGTSGTPHCGGQDVLPIHIYNVRRDEIFAPVVRVAWDLNPVTHGAGGTRFLSGSHKSSFKIPAEITSDNQHPLMEDYECPAGSMLVFSEALCHAAAPWTCTTHDRVTIFSHYLHAGTKYHEGGPMVETVMAMPPKRRTLFRGVWVGRHEKNESYSAENRAT